MLWHVFCCPKKKSAKKIDIEQQENKPKWGKLSHRNQQFRRSKEARHDNYFVETPHEQKKCSYTRKCERNEEKGVEQWYEWQEEKEAKKIEINVSRKEDFNKWASFVFHF